MSNTGTRAKRYAWLDNARAIGMLGGAARAVQEAARKARDEAAAKGERVERPVSDVPKATNGRTDSRGGFAFGMKSRRRY